MRHICWVLLTLLIMSCSSEPEEKTFVGTKVILFAGGTPEFFFSAAIANGAAAAAKDLGVELEVVYSNWSTNNMLSQFKIAMDTEPDGIAMMGHPGEEALDGLMAEAIRKGIVVTTLNVDLPNFERKHKAVGFGYVGQDLAGSSETLTNAAIRKFELQPGDKVLFFGVARMPNRGIRTRTSIEIMEAYGLEVIYHEDYSETDITVVADKHKELLKSWYAEHPDAKLIFDDVNVSNTAIALRANNIDPDHYAVVGFDISPDMVSDVSEGYIDLLSDQQPFLQGYLSVLQIALSNKWKFGGLNIDTGTGFVTRENLPTILPFIEEGIR